MMQNYGVSGQSQSRRHREKNEIQDRDIAGREKSLKNS